MRPVVVVEFPVSPTVATWTHCIAGSHGHGGSKAARGDGLLGIFIASDLDSLPVAASGRGTITVPVVADFKLRLEAEVTGMKPPRLPP